MVSDANEKIPLNPPRDEVEKSAKDSLIEPINDSTDTQKWSNSREFLLSCIAMSVGLGNVWRFPYVAYENGGGAFLIPYLVALFFIGRPIYFLELILGQFSSKSLTELWKDMAPIFRGIGLAQLFCCFYIVTYYCSLISLAIFYVFASFDKVLPWTICNSDIHTSIDGVEQICETEGEIQTQAYGNKGSVRVISPAEQYFLNDVLKAKNNIDDGIGIPDAKLVGCLAICYILLFSIMYKGIVSSGKVNYS